jgi:hypothetical protein
LAVKTYHPEPILEHHETPDPKSAEEVSLFLRMLGVQAPFHKQVDNHLVMQEAPGVDYWDLGEPPDIYYDQIKNHLPSARSALTLAVGQKLAGLWDNQDGKNIRVATKYPGRLILQPIDLDLGLLRSGNSPFDQMAIEEVGKSLGQAESNAHINQTLRKADHILQLQPFRPETSAFISDQVDTYDQVTCTETAPMGVLVIPKNVEFYLKKFF